MSRSVFESFDKKWLLIIVALLILVLYPITESVSLWKQQMNKLVCTKEADVCSLVTYSYEHKICWDTMFSKRTRRYVCTLPSNKTSENQVMNLSKIADIKVVQEGKFYSVKLVDKEGKEEKVAQYKDNDDAKYTQGQLRVHIKRWQSNESGMDTYGEKYEHTFDYEYRDDIK